MKRVRRLLAQPEGPRAALTPVLSAAILAVSAAVVLAAWQTTAPARPPAPPAPPAPMRLAQVQKRGPAPEVRATPYTKWLTEDVAYIITNEERAAFKNLKSDAERLHFIEQFWLRRDPTPGTVENEFKEEHYRRIAYANEHFAAYVPGWKTDRGRIYITYGPPDQKEVHPSGGTYTRPASEGGGVITAVPFEQWLYRHIEGVGENVIVEFIDPNRNGEYRMTMDPNEKDADAPPAAAQRFYVQGEVAHPGAYRLLMPTRVLGALVAAGGFKDTASPKQIVIMHISGESVPFNYEEVVRGGKPEQNILLQTGDIIIVK